MRRLILRMTIFVVLIKILQMIYRKLSKNGTPQVTAKPAHIGTKACPHSSKTYSGNKKSPSPFDTFAKLLIDKDGQNAWPLDALKKIFPTKYERHGHVIVITLNAKEPVAAQDLRHEEFAKSFYPLIDVVIVDSGGISGELRQPVHSIEWQEPTTATNFSRQVVGKIIGKLFNGKNQAGELITDEDVSEFTSLVSPTFTTHVEDGVKYSFDAMKIMFCSGNTTERMHFSQIAAAGETIVDMFAGIGYFTLPLAMRGNVNIIFALEKNPLSASFLKLNVHQNGVCSRVKVYCGDNREVTGTTLCGTADRVLMGYIPECDDFLPRAVSFLRKTAKGVPRGVIHYHFLAAKGAAYKSAYNTVIQQIGEAIAPHVQIMELREVKSYAPKKSHFVADLIFGHDILAH